MGKDRRNVVPSIQADDGDGGRRADSKGEIAATRYYLGWTEYAEAGKIHGALSAGTRYEAHDRNRRSLSLLYRRNSRQPQMGKTSWPAMAASPCARAIPTLEALSSEQFLLNRACFIAGRRHSDLQARI